MVRTKKPRGERCRSRLTRLPPDVLRVVLSYRDLPTRYACASASRMLRDTVARLPLGPERCLAQRRYPILATVCDVASLDAKTLGGLVRSQMDVTPIVTVGRRGSFRPAHAAAVELTPSTSSSPPKELTRRSSSGQPRGTRSAIETSAWPGMKMYIRSSFRALTGR